EEKKDAQQTNERQARAIPVKESLLEKAPETIVENQEEAEMTKVPHMMIRVLRTKIVVLEVEARKVVKAPAHKSDQCDQEKRARKVLVHLSNVTVVHRAAGDDNLSAYVLTFS
ncbi:hypothetical protein GOV10_01260, partial [Candidatus Woesearchaeota archaeon]|nr:hypothetical protein [Candidatus Woesearchaeota archaeon]